MGLKLEETGALNPKKKVVPPVGAYEPNYRKQVASDPSYSMKGRHTDLKRLNVPGPGTYNKPLVDKSKAPQYGFGTGAQTDMKINTLSPGPGAYKIPSTISDLPSYAMPGNNEYRFV